MRVLANNTAINCVLEGPEDAPVVTLSHSLAVTQEMWRPQIAALRERYRVLLFDTRGHGGSEAPVGAYTLEALAEDTVALLAALGIRRTHFVGLSMGGMIGQALALNRPDVLDRLVLADTMSRVPAETQTMWQWRIDTARAEGMAALVDHTVERWFTPACYAAGSDSIDQVRLMVRATAPTGYIGCCEAIRALDFTDRLGEIRIPTLVVVGEQDPGTPVAAAEVIHKGIPGSALEVIEGASHLSNIEQAHAFNRAVLGFLDAA